MIAAAATQMPMPFVQSQEKKQSATGISGTARSMSRYFAREGVDPLSQAFDGKLVVHPGIGGGKVSDDVLGMTLEKLLAMPRNGKSVAYIHVPFCETHCLYCGFYNRAYSPEESRLYADALIRELHLWGGKPAQEIGPVHAVYMGGGTPTALEADDLRRILQEVKSALPLANDCEITVEGRLSNFGPDKMEACLEGGANRFSLGVQSFNTEIRRSMGRMSSREELVIQLERLLSYDQAAVIVDLIYGFPRQGMEHWLEDIAVAQSLHLDGADCYQLNVYRHTPLGKAIELGKMPAGADIPMQSAMFAAGVDAMQKAFYRRLSVSHWARTSRERNLYNLYVKGRAHCLAFGPGAGGNLGGYFYLNRSDYRTWQKQVHSGQKPVAMLVRPAPHASLLRSVAEGMEQSWLDLPSLEAEFGVSLDRIGKPLFDQWSRAGLVERRGKAVVLTLAGQFWQVNLSQLLQEYLKTALEEECR